MRDMSIDQAADRMGISKDTLRYYEREGLLPKIARGANGHRRYTEDDLGWVKFLQLLRGTGMPIREMKDFVALTLGGDHTIPQRIQVLQCYRSSLQSRMEDDRERMQFLEHKIGYYLRVLDLHVAIADDAAIATTGR